MQDLSGLHDNCICSSMPKRNSSCTKNEEGIVTNYKCRQNCYNPYNYKIYNNGWGWYNGRILAHVYYLNKLLLINY